MMTFLAPAQAANPNLYVSAENSYVANHFTGSMVIELVVNDPNLAVDADSGLRPCRPAGGGSC